MKEFTIKINGKEIFIDDIKTALDLVEATYKTCDVLFCDNRLDGYQPIRIDDIMFSQLCDEYYDEV